MKMIATLFFLTASSTFAASTPFYEVVYQIWEKGKVVKSARMHAGEGRASEIKDVSEVSSESLTLTVKPTASKILSVDYRFKNSKNGKSIELAKTAVVLTSGVSEITDFKDTSGNDFRLEIIVTKK